METVKLPKESGKLARVESWVLDEPRSGKRLAVPFGAGPDVRKIYASAGKKPVTETVLPGFSIEAVPQDVPAGRGV